MPRAKAQFQAVMRRKSKQQSVCPFRRLFVSATAALAIGGIAAAEPLPAGKFRIELQNSTGETLELGTLSVADDGQSSQIAFDESLFSDHFLSMRPFRCMTRDVQMWCHLPYPYEKPATLDGLDLRSLEYDLLFIHRSASDYGIDAWNGLYFDIEPTTGNANNQLQGTIREVDLNILASPPENGIVWPITADDLHEAEPDRHMFNTISVTRLK